MEIEFYPSTKADNERALEMASKVAKEALDEDDVVVVTKETGRIRVVWVKGGPND